MEGYAAANKTPPQAVKVVGMSGKTMTTLYIPGDSAWQVSTAKREIESQIGVPASSQDLSQSGQKLKNDEIIDLSQDLLLVRNQLADALKENGDLATVIAKDEMGGTALHYA